MNIQFPLNVVILIACTTCSCIVSIFNGIHLLNYLLQI